MLFTQVTNCLLQADANAVEGLELASTEDMVVQGAV
jgi:hypothetical protein